MNTKLVSLLLKCEKRYSFIIAFYIVLVIIVSLLLMPRMSNYGDTRGAKQASSDDQTGGDHTSETDYQITLNADRSAGQSDPKIAYPTLSSNKRLWFLTNGSLRADPQLSSRLALWPDEGEADDDRIVNQLMYVPLGYDPDKWPVKTIFLYIKDQDWRYGLGRHPFRGCPVSSCSLVSEALAPNADLVFFKTHFKFPDYERPAGQLWLMFVLESPYSTADYKMMQNMINWTATYRHDSEIPTPYGKFFPYPRDDRDASLMQTNYASGKSKKVAWFVSNCYAFNDRLKYAEELKNYIQVDIFGSCGAHNCSRHDYQKCFQMLERDYKFYLSFENSNCKDYITEKFWFTALNHNIVPIVMGANASAYERQAPPNSFIHVDRFDSPKHLAEYLHFLDQNDSEYNKYLSWKGSGEVRHVMMWCRVCALLHSPPRTRIYSNFGQWWHRYRNTDVCHSRPWFQ